MTVKIVVGNCLDVLKTMEANSVHCSVSSPPYWGLRDYGIEPTIWGGDLACDHDFEDRRWYTEQSAAKTTGSAEAFSEPGEANAQRLKEARWRTDSVCCKCNAWRGAFGLEPTPELFIEHLTMIFEEVRRVLRPDGTLWLNLGDSYATGAGSVGESSGGGEQGTIWSGRPAPGATSSAGRGRGKRPAMGKHEYVGERISIGPMSQPNRMPVPGLKAKDLVGIPWMAAFALRKAGWWLRGDNIWHKPNPMPESTTDRCTKAHEYMFLLTKREHYYYDAEAIKEPATYAPGCGWDEAEKGSFGGKRGGPQERPDQQEQSFRAIRATRNKRTVWAIEDDFFGAREVAPRTAKSGNKVRVTAAERGLPGATGVSGVASGIPWEGSSRNKRTVWTVATVPYAEAHFATFPPALIEPCIDAGTSERGCCPICATPWERVIGEIDTGKTQKMPDGYDTGPGTHATIHREGREKGATGNPILETVTLGWWPGCDCDALPDLPAYPLKPSRAAIKNEDAYKTALAKWLQDCRGIDAERKLLCDAERDRKTVPAVVLDPFGGAGTTGLVADRRQRDALLIEMNPEYAAMARKRIDGDLPLFASSAAE